MSSKLITFLTAASLVAFASSISLNFQQPAHADEGDKPAEEGKKKGEKSEKSEKPDGDTFSVVRIGDEVKVVKGSEVQGLRKKGDEDFQASTKAWNDAKTAAAKSKKKFNDPKPVKQNLEVVAQAIKKQGDAEAIRDKKLKEIEAHKKKTKGNGKGDKGDSKEGKSK